MDPFCHICESKDNLSPEDHISSERFYALTGIQPVKEILHFFCDYCLNGLEEFDNLRQLALQTHEKLQSNEPKDFFLESVVVENCDDEFETEEKPDIDALNFDLIVTKPSLVEEYIPPQVPLFNSFGMKVTEAESDPFNDGGKKRPATKGRVEKNPPKTKQKLKTKRPKFKLINGTTYKCVTCNKQFGDQILMNKHMLKHYANRKHYCHVCYQPFANHAKLQKHTQNYANKPHSYCINCKANYVSKHSCKRIAGLVFKCKRCNRKFGTNMLLIQHTDTGCGSNIGLNCQICEETFKNQAALSIHLRLHHKKKTEYACPSCPLKFDSREERKNHLKEHDQPIEKAKCPVCQQECMNLNFHMSYYHDDRGIDWECCYCVEKRFNTKGKLQVHMMAKHRVRKDKFENLISNQIEIKKEEIPGQDVDLIVTEIKTEPDEVT